MMVRSPAAARALLEAGALLKSGVEADQRTDSDSRTALWQASCLGNAGAVKLLLDAGADPRLQAANLSAFDCARHGKETPAFASAR